MPDDDPHPLDYQTPDPTTNAPGEENFAAGCLIVLGGAGALLVLCGFGNFIAGLARPHQWFRSDDFDATWIILLIGIVCLGAALRWWFATKRRSGGR